MSNTKLSVAQKDTLRGLRKLFPDVEIFHFPDNRVCVGIQRIGEKMGEFSVAICAETETRYRKKVGELLVRERMQYGQCLPVELGETDTAEWEESDWDSMESIALNIAQAVTGF
jgi:hypothetical protein